MAETPQQRKVRQDNEAREKVGKKADDAADSQINQGDLGAAAKRAAGKAEAPTSAFSEPPPTPPPADAGLAEQAKYQKAKREWQARKDAAGLTAGKQAQAVK